MRCVPRSAASVRQSEPADLAHDAAELLAQGAAVVGNAVALADLAHLGRDLAVAIGRQVGKEVMLDLMAEIAREDVEDLAALQVRRAEDLAEVPLPAGLVGGLLL